MGRMVAKNAQLHGSAAWRSDVDPMTTVVRATPDFTAAAAQAVGLLVACLQPLAIVWFGSATRGQAGPDSDLDFLVVLPREAGEKFELFKRAQKAIWSVRAPVDLLIYYPDEIEDKRDSLGSVVRQALTTGTVVHGQV